VKVVDSDSVQTYHKLIQHELIGDLVGHQLINESHG